MEECYCEKIIKKVVSICLTAILVCSFSVCLFATSVSAATMRWASILSIDLVMVFDGNEGTVTGIASKQATASKIEGTVYVYKLVGDDWIYVDKWYNSKTRGTLGVEGIFYCESGVKYKEVFVVTAYTGTAPETETVEYIRQCP